MILAGDIGGTKTVVALYDKTPDGPRQRSDATFPSGDHESLEAILANFLEQHGGAEIETACFGIAGAVIDGRAKTTNLPWTVEESKLAETLGARRVKLLNDLEAAAYGMLALGEDERVVLSAGAHPKPRGNAVVIAAGTGLGEALLIWDGERHRAVGSEGGHADFAPRDEEQMELLRFLRAEFGRVSTERVLSGPGLFNLYRFTRHQSGEAEPEWLAEKVKGPHPSAAVSEAALSGRDPACVRALELFVSIYGAEAGNLALSCVATGGVYVGGAIAAKNLAAFQTGAFMQAFLDKGRFSELLGKVEVSIGLNPRVPLIGAADFAAKL